MLSFIQASLVEKKHVINHFQSCKLLSAPTTFARVDFRGRHDHFSRGGFYMLHFDLVIFLS